METKRTIGRVVVGVAVIFYVLAVAQAGQLERQGAGPSSMKRNGSLPDVGVSLTYTNTGSQTSQGDARMGSDAARSTFGVSGAGIKIGVISDSFNALGGWAGGVGTGDLPGPGNPLNATPVTVLMDDGGSDEGRALAEIVHDVAPGAQIYFHSAFNTGDQAGMATAVNNLVAAGVNIIVDDVGYLNEPCFQDGVIAQAMNNARAGGVLCFSSAGNQARESYTAPYSHTDMGGGWYVHDFDTNANEGGDILLNIQVQNNATMRAVVQWTDPYPSVGAPVGHEVLDLDVGLWDWDTAAYVDTSWGNQQGGDDPWELVSATNTSGSAKQYGLLVEYWAGSNPTDRDLKVLVYNGQIADDDDTNSPTVVGHSAAEGAAAIAAIRYDSASTVEWFSSAGPTDMRFDESGNPLLDLRDSLFLTGPDGGDTTFFGYDTDGDGVPEFFGTSASAPHVAAVAALMMERASTLGVPMTLNEILAMMAGTATDIESAGYDDLSGYGLIDAYQAVGGIAVWIPEPATLSLLALGGLALLRRRRKA